jgi:hypothetical protein
MKRLQFLTGMILIGFLFISSCDLIDDISNSDINPDETIAKEGNMWEANVTGYPGAKATIFENTKGIAKVQITYDSKDYFIYSRVSKKKIEDFVYSNGDESKPFTLCDFDAGVGTKWEYTVGTQKVVREVTYKSTTDDFYALGLLLKVTQVEETIPEGLMIAGYPAEVKKIKWTFNHKFGWVGAEVTKNDNTVVPVYLTDTNAGSGK